LGSYNATYEHFINPIQGEEFWEKPDYVKPVPAPLRRQPRRPKNKEGKMHMRVLPVQVMFGGHIQC